MKISYPQSDLREAGHFSFPFYWTHQYCLDLATYAAQILAYL